jgi:hypothetical protein
MSAPESWEIEVNPEEYRVRVFRQRALELSGFSEFAAFRLSMRFDVDWHQAADMLKAGATEDQVIDLLID